MIEECDSWDFESEGHGPYEIHFFRTAELMRDAIRKVEPDHGVVPEDAAGYCNLNGDDGSPMIMLPYDIITGDEYFGDEVVTHECAHLALMMMRKKYGHPDDPVINLDRDREEEFCELQGRLVESVWKAFGEIAIAVPS